MTDRSGATAPTQAPQSPEHRSQVFTGSIFRTRDGMGVRFADEPPPAPPEPVIAPAKVARMLALAHKLQRAIDCGEYESRADLARAYAQAGHYTKGVEMLSRLRGLGGTGPLADLVHVELAGWLAGEGRFEPAAKMLDTAIARLAEVGPVGLRARLARAVSVALARMGRVSTAVRLARSVDTAVRIAVLAGAGAQCARLRDEAGWKTIWTEAREKGAPGERVRTLLALTRAVVASSGYERAAPCLAAAKQAALAERRPGPRSIALNEVATLYCELEQFDVADRLSRKIQWYYLDAPDVRARLAESMARNGDWKQAMKWVRAVPSLDERERIAALVKRLVKREESPRAP